MDSSLFGTTMKLLRIARSSVCFSTSILLILLMAGCSPATENSKILGKWVGHAPDGDRVTYTFNQDGTVLWSVDSAGPAGSFSAKYAIDYSTEPAQIDIFEFNFEPLKDFTFLGIIEFEGPSRFRLQGYPQRAGQGSGRPRAFDQEAVFFTKQ